MDGVDGVDGEDEPADEPAGGRADDEPLQRALQRWVADAAADDAASDRARVRMLRSAAEDESTFAGVVVALAERATPVTVRTTAGRAHRGRVVAVGRDFLVVRDAEAPPVFVAFRAAVSVRPVPGDRGPALTGDRSPPLDARLAAVLGAMAADRPRVHAAVAGDSTLVAGELHAVGADMAVLRGDDGASIYVNLEAVAEVVVHDL